MRKDVNFSSNITKIVRNGKREKREMMWQNGERKSDFDNGIAEIFAQFLCYPIELIETRREKKKF